MTISLSETLKIDGLMLQNKGHLLNPVLKYGSIASALEAIQDTSSEIINIYFKTTDEHQRIAFEYDFLPLLAKYFDKKNYVNTAVEGECEMKGFDERRWVYSFDDVTAFNVNCGTYELGREGSFPLEFTINQHHPRLELVKKDILEYLKEFNK